MTFDCDVKVKTCGVANEDVENKKLCVARGGGGENDVRVLTCPAYRESGECR